MKAQRSLVVGVILATLWCAAYTAWQMQQLRDHASSRDPQAAPSTQTASRQDPSVRKGPSEQQDLTVVPSSDDKARAEQFAVQRHAMVASQLAARDITDKQVLEAMRQVPRHEFVPANAVSEAYADRPLPIGHRQTISQPYIVGLMTQLAQPKPTSVALDVGTGSGYQAAVLSVLCDQVYSIEIVEPLAESARERLARLKYQNVTVRHGDGYRGWPEHAPFDLIMVAAAPEKVPPPLIEQLKPGGRLVIPVGRYLQRLVVMVKQADGSVVTEKHIPVAFVPMTGDALKR